MKFFTKVSLILFSIIIFIISIMTILMSLKIMNTQVFSNIMNALINNSITLKVTIISSIILLIMSFRFIFFDIEKDNLGKDGIILENANGKLVITKESLENMIMSAAKKIDSVQYVNSKTLVDKEHKLQIYLTILVPEGTIVKDITSNLQNNIKEIMKNTADLEVANVSVTLKNIMADKTKGISSKKENMLEEEKKEE